jgi:hypothetical protein
MERVGGVSERRVNCKSSWYVAWAQPSPETEITTWVGPDAPVEMAEGIPSGARRTNGDPIQLAPGRCTGTNEHLPPPPGRKFHSSVPATLSFIRSSRLLLALIIMIFPDPVSQSSSTKDGVV